MRPRHAIAVSLISATTIVVFKWGADMFNGDDGRAPFAGRLRGRGDAADVRPVDYAGGGPADAIRGGPADYGDLAPLGSGPVDFVGAAGTVIPGTVHVVANGDSWRGRISGSGAIISEDGYIVTNSHVIDGAGSVMVTLSNRKTLRATVIGADAASDLAVLKVDAANLPFLVYGNSDDVKVGQWVMAVGYPLYLSVTATAGIVSAIGRNLGASFGQSKASNARIDSFIQTDAAVNLGNSGGPLVNTAGQLVGINTAMATPNGAYTGYSYSIPVNIVRRVVNEIIAHGAVKKG